MFGKMLDRFERRNDVDRAGGKRDLPRIAEHKAQIVTPKACGRMRHGWCVAIDGDYRARSLGEECRAVAFTARHIQHVFAAAKRARQKIAMKMFDLDLTGYSRC